MRLIDADSLISMMENNGWTMASIKTINDRPTIGTEKKANWIRFTGKKFMCSNCKATHFKKTDYCWKCGCCMKEESLE